MSTPLSQMDDLFKSELYLHFHNDILDEARTKVECDLIINACEIRPEYKVLDLTCGHGRHTNYLAAQKLKVTGIDLNESFLDIAKADAKAQNLKVEYIQQNILDIEYHEVFDTVLLLFNSIGFFDRIDSKVLFRKMARALKPGGKIFIDSKNGAHLHKEIVPKSIMDIDGDSMIDQVVLNKQDRTTMNHRVYIKDGISYDAPFTMWLYNYADFQTLAKISNLELSHTYGGWHQKPLTEESRRIILVFEKRG